MYRHDYQELGKRVNEQSEQVPSKLKNYITFAALAFAVAWAIFFPLITSFENDLQIMFDAVNGDLYGYYYAPWGLHFYGALDLLPYKLAYIVVNLINVGGLYYSSKTFRGNTVALLTSYALLFSLFYGQADGLWAGALVLMYVGIKRENTGLAVLGWLIALVKYYIGFPLGIGLLWCFAGRKQATHIIGITGIMILISFVVYGPYPIEILDRAAQIAPDDGFAIDLWQYLGPLVLVLWLPILLTRNRDYRVFMVTWALTTPYLHVHGLTHMVAIISGPIAWTNHIGYVIGFGKQLILLQITGLIVYILFLYRWYRGRNIKPDASDADVLAGETM